LYVGGSDGERGYYVERRIADDVDSGVVRVEFIRCCIISTQVESDWNRSSNEGWAGTEGNPALCIVNIKLYLFETDFLIDPEHARGC
jgi:hypothetical protein